MKKKSIIKLLALVNLTVSFSLALSPIDEKPTEDIQIEPISQVTEEVEVEPIQITEKSDEKQQKFSSTECTKKVEECQKKLSNPYSIILFIIWVSVILLFLFLLIKHNKDNEKPVLLILLYFSLLSIALISLLISFTPELNIYFLDKIDNNLVSKIGAIGDMFGSLNALFSGLTVIGVFTAIYLQRKELQAVKKEFNTQNENLKLQQFENTFFKLLENHRNVVNSVNIGPLMYESNNKYGLAAFMWLYERLKTPGAESKKNKSPYENFHEIHKNKLYAYFSNLFHLVKFIKSKKISDDVEEYIDIVRAQLSPHELPLIFYHALMDGNEEFKGLIKEYDLLKYLDAQLLLNSQDINLYTKGSFKK